VVAIEKKEREEGKWVWGEGEREREQYRIEVIRSCDAWQGA
jgi:hypothetical protein